METPMTTSAVAYFRTSSAANVGDDKDSQTRQRLAVQGYAARHEMEIVHEYYDAAVRGGDGVDTRPGFAEMIAYMSSNGARTILVESASRFSRDLITQETGYAYLKKLGFTLIAADDPDAFTSDTPTAVLIRQVLGAVSQFEKASLVAKLAGARLRKRQANGRCEGRKPAPDAARALARALRAEGLALRAIAGRLGEEGFLSPSGAPYGPESVKRMLRLRATAA
jgi:DNA invertase Pin-like site-specific DNA recombinase